MSDIIEIKGEKYSVYETEISHTKLLFYKENPRIYSVVNFEGADPTQQEIEDQMCSLEHVKQLKTSIMQYGGLAEPIYVRDGTFDVLEGNSRLAAYRLLNKLYPNGEWEYIKCKVLPVDIGEDAIRALLGTLHLVGRTNWSPFEQAGYLFRIKEKEKITDEELARNLGLQKNEVTNSIKIYNLMKNVDDISPEHWSYYAEYSKSKSINRKRKLFPNLDKAFSEHVKGNRIKQAMDVRTEFSKVLTVNDKATDKALKKFIDGEYSIYDVKDAIESTGKTDDVYKIFNNFRIKICTNDMFDNIVENYNSDIDFEINKILKQIKRIEKKLKGNLE